MPDDYLNSVNLNSESCFPYLCMDVKKGKSIPEPPGWLVWHWHEDFQFIYVFAGEMYLHTLERTLIVPAGSGAFINKNVVHLVLASPDCHYNSFLFPERLVSFYAGNSVNRYVKHIADCEELQSIILRQEVTWQNEILDLLKMLSDITPDAKCYEYEVLVLLAEIWLWFLRHLDLPERKNDNETIKRMQRFLTYIELHYAEDISLAELARSVGVSKSECLRCFKVTIQDTPYHYLMEYRLQKAAELLENTDQSVLEISQRVGFQSQSHFGQLFREKTGLSPSKYRKANR